MSLLSMLRHVGYCKDETQKNTFLHSQQTYEKTVHKIVTFVKTRNFIVKRMIKDEFRYVESNFMIDTLLFL